MKMLRTPVLCVSALLMVAAVAAAAPNKAAKAKPAADNAAKPAASAPGDAQQQQMDAMQKMAAPGPQHAILKSMEGHWKATVKSWTGPGDPQVSQAECSEQMMLGGRYLVESVKGTFMNAPFEGQGITGYDNMQKMFVMNWIDNMGTGMMNGTGTMDDAGKTLTITGTTPGMDGKLMPYRMVTTIADANNHKVEMFSTMGDKEVKMMEIDYTRE
ncbi:MAG TPA: DUF1579 domain-containing protein [Candidatus Eisenbacteria bacterium]|nr:DUF1579 domain-containing protein [Candidatus Eisenbacteria bacterium]